VTLHRTYIFTLDSLGSRHPTVLNNLRKYLKKEAEDKKNIVDTSDAIGKQALVGDLSDGGQRS
jgi:Ulp1 family protease